MYRTGAFAVPHPPIILPEVGRGEEKKIQKTIDGFHKVAREIALLKPDTVVLSSPHATMYADYFHLSGGGPYADDMRRFGAPSLKIQAEYDNAFTEALAGFADGIGFPAGTLGADGDTDHATFIPLYFLNQSYADYKLVRTGLSGLSLEDHRQFGALIAKTAERLKRRTVFIASGDLSHKLKHDGPYGYAKQGPEFDKLIEDAFSRGDFEAILNMDPAIYDPAAECGLRSFAIMAGFLEGLSITPELFSYEGPFGVGYATAAFTTAE